VCFGYGGMFNDHSMVQYGFLSQPVDPELYGIDRHDFEEADMWKNNVFLAPLPPFSASECRVWVWVWVWVWGWVGRGVDVDVAMNGWVGRWVGKGRGWGVCGGTCLHRHAPCLLHPAAHTACSWHTPAALQVQTWCRADTSCCCGSTPDHRFDHHDAGWRLTTLGWVLTPLGPALHCTAHLLFSSHGNRRNAHRDAILC
jgi:hypothetical protein